MDTVFIYADYKNYMKERLGDKAKGLISKWADAAGCQRSYMSQVLHQHVHLTVDQALGLGEYWGLTSDELDYFLLLVELERAATAKLRSRLQNKMKAVKAKQEILSKRFQEKEIFSIEDQTLYYSSWIWAVLHILVGIPELQTLSALSQKLAIPENQILFYLQKLESLGLLQRKDGKWQSSGKSIHLSKDSPLTAINHANMRSLAIADSQLQKSETLHYSSVFTLSKDDYSRLFDQVLKFLDNTRSLVAPSKEEQGAVLNIDLFKV